METGSTPETLVQEARQMAEAGKLEAARRLLGEALRLAPHSLPGWTLGVQLAANPKQEVYC